MSVRASFQAELNPVRRMYLTLLESRPLPSSRSPQVDSSGQRAFRPPPHEDAQRSPCLQSGRLGAKQASGDLFLTHSVEAEGWSLSRRTLPSTYPQALSFRIQAHLRETCPSRIKRGGDDPGRCWVCSSVYKYGFPYGNEPSAFTFRSGTVHSVTVGPCSAPPNNRWCGHYGCGWEVSLCSAQALKSLGRAGGTGPAQSGGGLLSVALTLSLQAWPSTSG